MGDPLMWWQRIVADVALEINPDTGLFAYRDVVISLMRQQGKTHLILATICARCLLWGEPQRCIYTMQDGHNARIKVKEELLPALQNSAIWPLVRRPYLSDGNTNILFENQSRLSVVSNSKASGEGRSGVDMIVLDEAHADIDDNRERALTPTAATRRNAQIWTPSTPGDAESVLFRRKVEEGRAAVRSGKNTGMAYFEFGVDQDEDPYDLDILRMRVPAYGLLVHDEYIEAEQRKPEPLYRRNVAGQWVDVSDQLIPGEWWRGACSHDVRADASCYAIDGRKDRSQAVVAKADRAGNVELVATKGGMNPEDELVEAFLAEGRRLPVVCDRSGPVSGAGRELESKGFEVVWLDSTSVRQACGRFYDALADQKIHIRSDDRLDVAARNAAQKTTSDLNSWNRDAVGGELLMAVSLAYSHAVTVDEWQPMVAAL